MKNSTILILFALSLLSCEKDKEENYYTLTINSSEEGTVDYSPLKDQYLDGELITITAIPNQDYSFVKWTGDIYSVENPISLLMDDNTTITPTYILTDTDKDGVPDYIDQCPDTKPGVHIDSKGCDSSNHIYLDENGVTVIAGEEAYYGDSKLINGKVYTVTDYLELKDKIKWGVDVSCLITSKITDMHLLFHQKDDFNQDISSWDVSNVTDMRRMFLEAFNFNQDLNSWDVGNVTLYSEFSDGADNWVLPKPIF